MQDTPPGERTRLWGISPVVLCWQSDVCFLLLWYLPCSLQHVPAEVSSASLLLNTHSHVQTHTLYLFCVSLEKKGKKSSSSWRSKPAACWSKRRSRFIQSCLVWLWAWPKRFLRRKSRLIAGTWKKLRGGLMGSLATLPPSALEVKELPACSTRWKQNHQRLQVRMESWWLLLWLFVPPISSWQFLTITVGCLLTPSAAEVVYLQRRRFDVRAAAVSVAFRKEKEPRSPPDRVCQDFTPTGRLARPVAGEVRYLREREMCLHIWTSVYYCHS